MAYRVKHGSRLVASGGREETFALAAEVSRLLIGIVHVERKGGETVRRYVNGKAMPSSDAARRALRSLRFCSEA